MGVLRVIILRPKPLYGIDHPGKQAGGGHKEQVAGLQIRLFHL
jgi:hypothetical protein